MHWPSRSALHLVVTVFSEHPSLLEGAQRQAWRPFSEAQVGVLAERLETEALPPHTAAPALRFHGLAITPNPNPNPNPDPDPNPNPNPNPIPNPNPNPN